MKKVLLLLLCFSLCLPCVACKEEKEAKVGYISVGDETEGYSASHLSSIAAAAEELGVEVVYKKKVEESQDVCVAAKELIAQGCTLIISNSYGHQDFMAEVAEQYPKVNFVSMTGDYAAISGLPNFYNAFNDTYESRYVSGVVAGMKLKELVADGKLTEKNYDGENIKIGYVGAFNYAEVVSGYTAFYLGVKSVVENVVMEVQYTSSWFDFDKEAAAAENLMSRGCVIIGQHADSEGAPSAVEKAFKNGTLAYSVGFNVSMLGCAPDVALTSALNNWEVYYKTLLTAWKNGSSIPQDWSEGYKFGAVSIGELGKACADGTAEKVAEVIDKLHGGELHVFDVSTFTVGGKHITEANVDFSYYSWATGSPELIYTGLTLNVVHDGYFDESFYRSAPYFSLRIDGIEEKN